jgi:hypothetical protein
LNAPESSSPLAVSFALIAGEPACSFLREIGPGIGVPGQAIALGNSPRFLRRHLDELSIRGVITPCCGILHRFLSFVV